MGLVFRKTGILKGKLVTTFRGIDISSHVQEQGEQVYDQLFEEGDFFLANCEFFRRRAIKLGCDERKLLSTVQELIAVSLPLPHVICPLMVEFALQRQVASWKRKG
jgi:hypothetical protein